MICPFNNMNPCYGDSCMLFLKLHEATANVVAQELDDEVVQGMCAAAYIGDKPSFMTNVFLTKQVERKFEIPDEFFKEVM